MRSSVTRFRTIVPLLVLLFVAGCYGQFANLVTGSGVAKSEPRQLPAFDGIRVEGAADVVVTVGGADATSVIVAADDNILPLIETTVSGGQLVVSSREAYRPKTPVKVTVTTPGLARLELNGSGDGTVTGVSGEAFEASVRGSGDIRLERVRVARLGARIAGSGDVAADGSADDLNVSINGSGNVRAADLTARTAEVTISGSGNAIVNASETLRAKIAGSGDVRYRGSPKVESSIAGSGNVRPAK